MAQLAREVGVSSDTVRYYERRGLLVPPPRSSSGYRRYDTAARDRLWFIRGAQRLGLSLTEITDLLAVRDAGTCPCGPGEDLLRHRLVQLDDEIQQLSTLRTELVGLLSHAPSAACRGQGPDGWPTAAELRDRGVDQR